MSCGEGTNIGFQLAVAGKAQSMRRRFGRLGHRWGPGAKTWESRSFRSVSSLRRAGDARGVARDDPCYERFVSGRWAKRPGPVLMKREASPLTCTSRIIAAYNVAEGVLP